MTTFFYSYRESAADGDELRWSIRSVVENFIGDAEIVIGGDYPPWYQGQCLSVPRIPGRYQDSFEQLRMATMTKAISDPFVWMHDDHVLCAPVDLDWLATPRSGHRITPKHWQAEPESTYRKMAYHSARLAYEDGGEPYWYCTHLPLVFHKEPLRAIFEAYPWDSGEVLIDQLYGAHNWSSPLQASPVLCWLDVPLADPADVEVHRMNRQVLSHTTTSWKSGHLRLWLQDKFPTRSQYEAEEPESTTIDLRSQTIARMMQGKDIVPVKVYDCPYLGDVIEYLPGTKCGFRSPQPVYECRKFGKTTRSKVGCAGVEHDCTTCPVTMDRLQLV